ncbi:MAG: hypothetical protein SNJ83_05755 [Aggregatilineales bacterium]
MRWMFLILWCAAIALTTTAQSDLFTATTHRNAVLYAGPGDTFRQVGFVREGVELRIIERNRIGNWLYVRRGDPPNVVYEGWIMRGYIRLNPQLRYTDVPVNENVADGDPTTLANPIQRTLAQVPVIPRINPLMRVVLETGIANGHQPNVVTRVGDSVIQNQYYLRPFAQTDVAYGAYDYLMPTVRYFGASLADSSIAAQVGMSSFVVFDSLWARSGLCQPNETPLACEYRVKKPAFAFISFGPNDVISMNEQEFREQMRRIVQESLATGVIPILSTFSVDPTYQLASKSMAFNLAIVEISQEFAVPLINLWLAARPLPQYGLDVDKVHYLNTGYPNIVLDRGLESWYGVALQNLLAIRTLHELYVALDMANLPPTP